MLHIIGTTRREAVRFLAIGALTLAEADIKRRLVDLPPVASDEEDESGAVWVDTGRLYAAWQLLFDDKDWGRATEALLSVQWEPFVICDAYERLNVFSRRVTSGWRWSDAPVLEPVDGGAFALTPGAVNTLQIQLNHRHEDDGWHPTFNLPTLVTTFIAILAKRAAALDEGRLLEPDSVTTAWLAAFMRTDRCGLPQMRDKPRRCDVCGTREAFVGADPLRARWGARWMCPHCGLPVAYGSRAPF